MPAGFGGGGGLGLPEGKYVAQIKDHKKTKSKKPNDRGEIKDQFQWGIDVWVNSAWVSKSIYTSCVFSDLSMTTDPKFISGLTKLVRACGMPLPTNAAEAEAWQEDSLIGKQFGLVIQANPEAPSTMLTYYVPLPPQGQPATAPQPAPAAAPSAVPAPVSDPFVGNEGATAPPAAMTAAVAGPVNPWPTA